MTEREIPLRDIISHRVLTEYLERTRIKCGSPNGDPFQFNSDIFDDAYLKVARHHRLRYHPASSHLTASEATDRVHWIQYKQAARQKVVSALGHLRRNRNQTTVGSKPSATPMNTHKESPLVTRNGQFLLPGFTEPPTQRVWQRLRNLAST